MKPNKILRIKLWTLVQYIENAYLSGLCIITYVPQRISMNADSAGIDDDGCSRITKPILVKLLCRSGCYVLERKASESSCCAPQFEY